MVSASVGSARPAAVRLPLPHLRALSVLAVCVAGLGAGALATPQALRLTLAGAASLLFIALATRAPRAVFFLFIVWLAELGLLRRVISAFTTTKLPTADPLLIVSAVVWIVLAAVAIRRGAFGSATPFTKTVLLFMGALTLSALNPEQHSLSVAVAGLFLTVVPMLAFIVGRELISDATMKRLLVAFLLLGLLAAGYGLFQTFRGFPSWDDRWIRDNGYAALSVNGHIRPFSSFASASEYATFLAAAIAAVWTIPRLSWAVRAPLFSVFALGIWFESSRFAVVLTLAAIALMTAARYGVPLLRSVALGIFLLLALSFGLSRVATGASDGKTAALAQHQISGLGDPFGQESTLPAHIGEVTYALRQSVRKPLGFGVGSATAAAAKFSGTLINAEADPGNAAVAAGVIGFALYIAVVVMGFRRVYSQALARRRPVDLAAVGILVVTFLQWLTGAQYAVAFMPWLVLGWIDRPRTGVALRAI